MIGGLLTFSLCLSEFGDNRVTECSGAQRPFSRLWSVTRDIVSDSIAGGNGPLLMNGHASVELLEWLTP